MHAWGCFCRRCKKKLGRREGIRKQSKQPYVHCAVLATRTTASDIIELFCSPMFLQEVQEEARKSGGHKKAVKGASDMRRDKKT